MQAVFRSLLLLVFCTLIAGEGSRNLFPTNANCGNFDSGGQCRANFEWRTSFYGPSTSQIIRRTLLQVYVQATEVVLMGSTARNSLAGATLSDSEDIVVWSPSQIDATIKGWETIPTAATTNVFSCRANTPTPGPTAPGFISSRAQELAGPLPSTGGYTPCVFTPLLGGLYYIGIFGPWGRNNDTNGVVTADIKMALGSNFDSSQGSSVTGWDVTVRSAIGTADINGRVFTYAFSAFTANNGLPVFMTLYPVTNDGYRYKLNTAGLDPNGWTMYGSLKGFENSDGSPLYHDVRGTGSQLAAFVGSVGMAKAAFPQFINPADPLALQAIGIPLTPVTPTISNISFAGNVRNAALLGQGGTFSITTNISGIFDIIISAGGLNYDPTLPANRVIRGYLSTSGTSSVSWDGYSNSHVPFSVGGPYSVRARIHAGEYHFPFIDVEASRGGGPSLQLLNAPCPPFNGSCYGAFYDDRGYTLVNGVVVGTTAKICGAIASAAGPTVLFSDPEYGFNTSTNQRAFGGNTPKNKAIDCPVPASFDAFGDAKGLDLWTYTPSNATFTPLWVIDKYIAGNVYYDNDRDMIHDSAESGVAGLVVTLAGATTGTATTDSLGNYFFNNLPSSGNYTVTVTTPGPYIATTNNLQQTVVYSATANGNAVDVGIAMTLAPTKVPTKLPTASPTTKSPTKAPTAPTTLMPTQLPTRLPTLKPTTSMPTTRSPTTSTSSSPVLVPYLNSSNETIIEDARLANVKVIIPRDPQFSTNGTFSLLTKNGSEGELILSVDYYDENGTLKNISNLSTPIRMQIPLPRGSTPVTMCQEQSPSAETLRCSWLNVQDQRWQTSGCTTSLTATYIYCNCSHLTDFAGVLPDFNRVPLRQFLELTTANIQKFPGGAMTIGCTLVLFAVVLLGSIRRDLDESRRREVLRSEKFAKWNARRLGLFDSRLGCWARYKNGLQVYHSLGSLLWRKVGTSYGSVDRTLVSLMVLLTLMSMSALFHERDQNLLGRIIVVMSSVCASLFPSLLLTHLFTHTGEMGFLEQWHTENGLQEDSECRCLRYRFAACWRWVWYAGVLVIAVALIVYVMGVALMFDQNPWYYCQGETTLAWMLDFLAQYAISIFLVEPVKIFFLVLLDGPCRGSRMAKPAAGVSLAYIPLVDN